MINNMIGLFASSQGTGSCCHLGYLKVDGGSGFTNAGYLCLMVANILCASNSHVISRSSTGFTSGDKKLKKGQNSKARGCEVWEGEGGEKRQGRAILDYVTPISFFFN